MNTLPLPVRNHQACFEIDLPLHDCTDSGTHVAELVGTLLNDIAGVDCDISHDDILQALAITTAVRMAMADAAAKPGVEFSLELLDVKVESTNKVASSAA